MTSLDIKEVIGAASLRLHSLLLDNSKNRADVANLRKTSAVVSIADKSDLWSALYDGVVLPEGISETERDRFDRALLATLQIFALHLRKNKTPYLYKIDGGLTVGEALSHIQYTRGNQERRINALFSGRDFDDITHRLGSVLRLENSKPIDYGLLVWELFKLQAPYRKKDVLLRWGQDYYRVKNSQPQTLTEGSTQK